MIKKEFRPFSIGRIFMSHFQEGKVVVKKEFMPISIGSIFMSHFQDGKVVIKKEFMPISIGAFFTSHSYISIISMISTAKGRSISS